MNVFVRLFKYLCVTLLGTLTDTVVLYVLTHLVFSEDNYLCRVVISPMISFECAVMVNYFTAFFYLWKDRITERNILNFLSHFWKYNLSCITAFLFKMSMLVPLEATSGWDVVICNLIAVTISGLLNFTINEKIVFRKKKEDK